MARLSGLVFLVDCISLSSARDPVWKLQPLLALRKAMKPRHVMSLPQRLPFAVCAVRMLSKAAAFFQRMFCGLWWLSDYHQQDEMNEKKRTETGTQWKWMNEWMDGCRNEWIDGRMNEWMNEWRKEGMKWHEWSEEWNGMEWQEWNEGRNEGKNRGM